MLDLLLLIHGKTFTEIDNLLQLEDHLIREHFWAACQIIDIPPLSRSICFRTSLFVNDGLDREEPIDELFAFLEDDEPLVHLIFLVSSEQQDGLIVEVHFNGSTYLMLAHLDSRRRPPNADNLSHFKDLGLLQLGLVIVTSLLEESQVALNRVQYSEAQGRLAWLLL